MDLLSQYDFDALPYIDKEYDIPIVQEKVHELISNEMRSFKPRNYLSHMPLPPLKFSSPILQAEMERMQHGAPMEKIDVSRYTPSAPEAPLDKDIQSWKRSIANIKAQSENQAIHMMNLELADQNAAKVYLHHNTALEGTEREVSSELETKKRKINAINADRKLEQESIRTELAIANSKCDRTIQKAWEIKRACDQMEMELTRE